jgi:TolB-like protein/Tfp pilus assembly protein PilF
MSPEQATGEASLDGRSDLYSLGCVLYEMLAGEPPFTGATPQSILAKRLATTAAPLSVVRLGMPTTIVNAVERALRQSPTDRFRTVAEFVAALESRSVGTPADDSRTTPAPALSPATIRRRSAQRRWLALVALAGLVGSVALVGFWAARARHRSGAALALAAPKSIAVLPLANVGGDTTNEYFADGISEELASALGKVPGLRVAARTSAFTFKGKNPTPQEIRDRLHVAAFLTGSVRRAGTTLRVTTELVNVQDGLTLWTETYEREIRDVRDVFQVQDDIAHAVVAALGVINAGTGAPLVHRTTVSAEAHDLYLKGRFAWNRRTRVALQRAAQYFEQAIALDSGYADAFAGLADALVLLPQYGGAEPRVAWPQARIAAERALALDSTLAEAHASLAYGQFQHEWKWDDAESGFRRALALDPNYATGHQWYGDFLDGRGRLQEALEEFKRAQQLDPLSRVIGMEVGWGLYRLHRYDEAVAAAEQVVSLDPNFAVGHVALGLSYLQKGRLRQAVEELQQSVAVSDRDPRAVADLSCAYAALGIRDSALALLAELRGRSAREYVPPSTIATVYASLGDRGNAFRWISRAVEEHDSWLVEDFFEPLLDPLRSDPRFQPVTRSLGLK